MNMSYKNNDKNKEEGYSIKIENESRNDMDDTSTAKYTKVSIS